ncbi:MAG: hypothetical protein E7580_06515 [Ruminococcaceae bacterium]|nr:hypothetical protein [Oscillospiraceae bacterium]
MKKIVGICLFFVIVSSLFTVSAAGKAVKFTSSSSFEAGGTATVDEIETAGSVLDDGSVSSELYNAALEHNMSYTWRCSNGTDKEGKSVTWTEADVGKEFFCRVSFFSDGACTEFVDYIDSSVFTVGGGEQEVKISPSGEFRITVGEEYSLQLTCNAEGVRFDRFRTSMPDGLEITPDGLIFGTPTKEGIWRVVIAVYKNEEQLGSEIFDFFVEKANVPNPPSEAETPAAPAPSASEKPEQESQPAPSSLAPATTTEPKNQGQPQRDPLLYVILGILILVIVAIVLLFVVLLRKKKA